MALFVKSKNYFRAIICKVVEDIFECATVELDL